WCRPVLNPRVGVHRQDSRTGPGIYHAGHRQTPAGNSRCRTTPHHCCDTTSSPDHRRYPPGFARELSVQLGLPRRLLHPVPWQQPNLGLEFPRYAIRRHVQMGRLRPEPIGCVLPPDDHIRFAIWHVPYPTRRPYSQHFAPCPLPVVRLLRNPKTIRDGLMAFRPPLTEWFCHAEPLPVGYCPQWPLALALLVADTRGDHRASLVAAERSRDTGQHRCDLSTSSPQP